MQPRSIKRSSLLVIVAIVVVLIVVALYLARGKFALFGTAVQPTTVINTAYSAVSKLLGKTVSPNDHSVYIWTQSVYPDTSLGCPQPGQTYPQVQTGGYEVTITFNGVNYDYRAKDDGTGLFLCASVQAPGGPVNVKSDGTVDEPVALVNAVIADLNSRRGTAYTRDNSRFFYTYASYADSSLGCPQPGQTYTQAPIFGWQILVKPNAGGSFDYRGFDETHFWPCAG